MSPLHRVGLGADDLVSQLFVDAWQFSAKVDELQIHEVRAGFASELFGSGYEAAAQAGSLAGRIDRQQAEIGVVSVAFDVHAARDPAFVSTDEKDPLFEVGFQFCSGQAVSLLKEAFDLESSVDEAQDRTEIAFCRGAKGHGTVMNLRDYSLAGAAAVLAVVCLCESAFSAVCSSAAACGM